jgi:hypothetical protein
MKEWRRLFVPVVGALVLVGVSLPASATHNADSHSENMVLKSHLPRSSAATQSDFAFRGKWALSGNYNGFRIIDVSDPDDPVVVRDVWCPGPQNDISIWGDAIVLSVDSVRAANPNRAGAAASDCDSVAASNPLDPAGWEGLRVFSLGDILAMTPGADGFVRPVSPAAAVYTDCGSHTHTGVPHGNHVDVYVSSYPLREGPGCGPNNPQGEDPLHKKISIVKVDPGHPSNSQFLKEVPVNVPTWNLLPAPFNPMQGCHDIQIDMSLKFAAAACSSVGQLWDISDPENPGTLNYRWQVDEPQVQFYHSALFSEDEETVIFGDEIISGSCDDGSGSGQAWFHAIGTGATQGSFQIPRPQPGQYCSAHMFNNIPTPMGDILVAAWYAGGVTVVDYGDRANAKEIGYYDISGNSSIWSAYWYNGFIYGSDIPRGFNTYLFSDRARAGAKKVAELNPQTQN